MIFISAFRAPPFYVPTESEKTSSQRMRIKKEGGEIPSSHYSAILIITHNMRPVSSTLVHFSPEPFEFE